MKILAGEMSDALVVPLAGVAEAEQRHWCYVVGEHRMERREVQIGAHTKDFVEILSGLKEGMKVALDARHRAMEDLNQGRRPAVTGDEADVTSPTLAATN